MTGTPPYVNAKHESALAADESILIEVLKACRPLRNHHVTLHASGRSEGEIALLMVHWHWASAERVLPPLYHADSVSLLVRNMPEQDIRDAKRKWQRDTRLSGLPTYIDIWWEGTTKRVILHHCKAGL